MPEFDVAIVGSGPGGYVAAIRAAQLGLRAAIIEKDAVGGLCLNWGCIPSKALLYCAELVNLFQRGSEFGIGYTDFSADFGVAVDRSRDIVATFVKGIETLLSQNKVAIFRGTARLTGPKSLELQPGNDTIQAENILLATGGHARTLPNVAVDGQRVITSREALELRDCPSSVIILGGGAIGVEFGYLYRSYGAEVTIIEALASLLPNEDDDVSRQIERSFRAQGISIETSTRVDSVTPTDDGLAVAITGAEQGKILRAEKVLIGVGFAGNTESLGLESLGVELEKGFIKIDGYCQTNVPGVWAIGDVTGKLPLAHVASQQGVTAVEKMAGKNPPQLKYDQMPRAVYCQPQVASQGLTESQALTQGYDVRSARFPFRANGKALAIAETEGFVKIVSDKQTAAILGYHMVGHNATEMLGEATIAGMMATTSPKLGAAVHAHPTLSEAMKEAALAVSGEAVHFFSRPRA